MPATIVAPTGLRRIIRASSGSTYCQRCHAAWPASLFRNFAAGKGGSLAGRLLRGHYRAVRRATDRSARRTGSSSSCTGGGERPASHNRSAVREPGSVLTRCSIGADEKEITWPSCTRDRQMRGSRPSYLSPCSSVGFGSTEKPRQRITDFSRPLRVIEPSSTRLPVFVLLRGSV